MTSSRSQPENEPGKANEQTPGQPETSLPQSSPPEGVISLRLRIVYPEARERSNRAQHGRSLDEANRFDWATAYYRRGPLESRACGVLAGVVVVLSFRDIDQPGQEPCRRVTLLRDATPQESARYLASRPTSTE